jgi:Cysteine dioxygenase type I
MSDPSATRSGRVDHPAHGPSGSTSLALHLARRPELWRPLVRHVPGERAFAAVPDLVDAEAWVITWAPGSGLDLHDHGGARGGMALVAGTLSERHGRRSVPGALRTRVLDAGAAVAFEADHVHEVRNLGVVPAISIHVYAPALRQMRFYGDDPRDDWMAAWPDVLAPTTDAMVAGVQR